MKNLFNLLINTLFIVIITTTSCDDSGSDEPVPMFDGVWECGTHIIELNGDQAVYKKIKVDYTKYVYSTIFELYERGFIDVGDICIKDIHYNGKNWLCDVLKSETRGTSEIQGVGWGGHPNYSRISMSEEGNSLTVAGIIYTRVIE